MMLATARTRATRRAAFTLLEILVVVAIVVILAGVGVVATTSYLENAKKSKAQLGAKGLQTACETYYLNNGGTLPPQLADLLNPPTGGPLLKNGQNDLLDPWGKAYQYEQKNHNDGTQYPYISTTAPDGLTISQYGLGQASAPPQN